MREDLRRATARNTATPVLNQTKLHKDYTWPGPWSSEAAMCFRFNNRKNPYLFRDTLTKMLQSPHLELKELTAEESEPAA